MASREPHFTLVLGGEPVLTLCNHNALFHTILLFLQVRPLGSQKVFQLVRLL